MTEHAGTRLFSMHLSMVARIALGSALLATLILALTLMFAVDSGGTTYAELVQAHSITQRNLGPAFLVAGLVLAVVIGLLTWAICLFSSFRVAGPLFRFTRNLEQASEMDEVAGIRQNDCLHDLADELKASIARLHEHYRELDALAEEALHVLDQDGERADDRLKGLIEDMEAVDHRARVDV